VNGDEDENDCCPEKKKKKTNRGNAIAAIHTI
jgi:hypothetical protein